MSSDRPSQVLPAKLVAEVEMFVDHQHDQAEKYDNVELLDEGGVSALHGLAARIYAAGWEDGRFAESARNRGASRRARARGGSS